MVAEVMWSRDALRELTIWLAGFIRDEIELRSVRTFILEDVKAELMKTDGQPDDSYNLPGATRTVVVWEYVGRTLWLVFRRVSRPRTWWQRLTGRTIREAIIVAALRRPPTLQELEALQE
jgi:hypothetical protein